MTLVSGGQAREGLTEHYLSVLPADPPMPRGTRFHAVLQLHDGGLTAIPVSAQDSAG